MKRKFAILTALGAILALSVPASSLAVTMSPAGAKFEIYGAIKVESSLGYCEISKITGQVPNAPANSGSEKVAMPVALTVGSCSAGTTVALGGFQGIARSQARFFVDPSTPGTETVIMRFSSLPGCKLVSTAGLSVGLWSNGVSGAAAMESLVHYDTGVTSTWKNDGATCALAGQNEYVYSWSGGGKAGGGPRSASFAGTKNLTTPGSPILITN
jgi:hypothetical protein